MVVAAEPSHPWVVFIPIFQSTLGGGDTKFVSCIGASAIKSYVRSRIFRYGLRKNILSKGQKNKGGGPNQQRTFFAK